MLHAQRLRAVHCLLSLAAACPLAAALPPLIAPAVSITGEVRQIDQRDTLWSTSWGSYNKEFLHKRTLAVQLKTVGQFDPEITITWAFVGSDIDDGNKFLVFAQGERNVIIPRAGELRFNLESPAFTGSDRKYNALGQRDRDGIRPAGWAIMIWQRGRFVSGQGSTPEMLSFAKTNTKPPTGKSDDKKKADKVTPVPARKR